MLFHFHLLDKSQNFVPKWSFHEESFRIFWASFRGVIEVKIIFFHLLSTTRYFRFGFINLMKILNKKMFFFNIRIFAVLTWIWPYWNTFLLIVVESSDLVIDFLMILIFDCTFIRLKLNQMFNRYSSDN